MNNIALIGRLTSNPELKTTQSGLSVCSYTLAVDRPRVKDTTDFIQCVTWRQSAEYLSKYGRKGNRVAVTGSLTTRKWTDGNGNTRTAYEVVTDSVQVLDKNEESNVTQFPPAPSGFSTAKDGDFEEIVPDEELPF